MPRRRATQVSVEKESDLITVHRKRRAPLPTDESPRDKFIRLCEPRVTRAANEIRKIKQLFNPRVYQFTPKDLDLIETILDKKIAELRATAEVVLKQKPANRPQVEVFRLQA